MAKKKTISKFTIDTSSIRSDGETRDFSVIGDRNAVFSIEVLNEDGHYYNFDTRTFSATRAKLDRAVLRNRTYNGRIQFPKITDDDHYDIFVYAEPTYGTRHAKYAEKRFLDNTIDVNKSTGSDSLMLSKKIYQYTDVTLTLTAISPNSVTGFSSMSTVTDTVTLSRGKSLSKIPFTVVVTAAATRNFSIIRQPTSSDVITYVERTIGSAAIPIRGEDVSSSTYYKWPLDNVAGLKNGMFIANATNVTTGTTIRDYSRQVESISRPAEVKTSTNIRVEKETPSFSRYDTSKPSSIKTIESKAIRETVPSDAVKTIVFDIQENGVQPTGDATLTDGIVTAQAGNVVFNLQQADALKDDDIKVYGYGPEFIKSISNYKMEFSDLKVELTDVTTTTTASTIGASSTSVQIAERAGIRDGNVSTVTGIGIDTSSAIPTVASGAGAVNGAGTIVLSAAQELEDGVTLTFGKTSRIATITGNISIKEVGLADATIRFDMERFLKAV